jgi:hypothetical protein
MVKGTMRWLSSTEEFGFVEPEDGGREVFVRLSSGNDPDGARVGPASEEPADGAERHALASRVEVSTQYQGGHWAGGYEIAGIVRSGYHVRRPGSLDVLPSIFVPADVRQAGDLR